MAIDAFFFDLDGTLVDSVDDLAASVNRLRSELLLPPLEAATVRGFVGDGARLLVARSLPDFSEAHLRRFLEIYGAHLLDRTTVYPGIREFLDLHRRRPLAVITNKPLALSLALLRGLDLLSFFPVVLGGRQLSGKKPHPAPVRLALKKLGCRAETTVMIGDHHTDLQAGRGAGVRTCYCAWGIGQDGGIPHDFRAETPADLRRLFPGVA